MSEILEHGTVDRYSRCFEADIPYDPRNKELIMELQDFFDACCVNYTLLSFYAPGENPQHICTIENHRKGDDGEWKESGCIVAKLVFNDSFYIVELEKFFDKIAAKYEIDQITFRRTSEVAVMKLRKVEKADVEETALAAAKEPEAEGGSAADTKPALPDEAGEPLAEPEKKTD